MTVFEQQYARGHQSLDRDHLEYCDLAADRQRRSHELVRAQHLLSVSRIERRNSALSDALNQLPVYATGGWVWVYNSESTIRQGARSGTDDKVLKAKLSLLWTGPFKILAVGPDAEGPDGRLVAAKLLYLELPSDMPGKESKRRVSVVTLGVVRPLSHLVITWLRRDLITPPPLFLFWSPDVLRGRDRAG